MNNTPLLMSLKKLLSPWLTTHELDIKISGLNLDSRKIVNGNLFVALQGELLDGRTFIDKAINQGAVAVL